MSSVPADSGETRATVGLVADTIAFSNVDGPGNRMVVFLQGCNFDCGACHNPQTIHRLDERTAPARMLTTVAGLLPHIRRAAPFLSGITVTGGEPTQQPDFLFELFRAMGSEPVTSRLTCFVDSNGACELGVWDRLAPVMHGAMIDLKCLDPAIHEQLTGQPNAQVLASIEHLHRLGLLYEVRMLLIAGVNDDPDLIRRSGAWLAAIDRGLRIKVIGFRRHGARAQRPPLAEPSHDQLLAAADILRAAGSFDLVVV